jgi:hypothetical protein
LLAKEREGTGQGRCTCFVVTFIKHDDSVEAYARGHDDEKTKADDTEKNDFLLKR